MQDRHANKNHDNTHQPKRLMIVLIIGATHVDTQTNDRCSVKLPTKPV
jgi:hypothetical protein